MLSTVSFISSAVITGFFLTRIQQKNFFKKVFKNTDKFDYQFDYKTGASGTADFDFKYAYFMDWVPLYSKVSNNYFYNLLFNGLTPNYKSEVQNLVLFKNINKDSLSNFFGIFDLSDAETWEHDDQIVDALTTVTIKNNHISYKIKPDFLVDTLQKAWRAKKKTAFDAYFRSAADCKIALMQKKLLTLTQTESLNYLNDLTDFNQLQLANWISNSVADIFNNFVLTCARDIRKKTINDLNAKFQEKHFPFVFKESQQRQSNNVINQNKELFYQFIFGKPTNSERKKNKNYCDIYSLSADSKGRHFLKVDSTNPDYRFETGLRGMVAPIAENTITNKIFFFAKSDFIFNGQLLISNPQIYIERFERHLGLVANLTDWKLRLREEQIVFDFLQHKKRVHRLVFLNNRPNYVGPFLISGRRPLLDNEVMISPQYARDNHINLGSWISIAGNLLHIVGIATDPFSFLPNDGGNGNIFADTKYQSVIYLFKFRSVSASAHHFFGFITQKSSSTFGVMQTKADNFLACLAANPSRLSTMIDFLGANARDGLAHHDLNVAADDHLASDDDKLKLTAFADSSFRWNWQIFSYLMIFFDAVGLIGLSVLVLLIMLITIIVSSRLIKSNQRSIGYLRASGLGTFKTSWRYVWWSLILLPLPIVVGWTFGIFMPSALNLIFTNVFSSVPQFAFGWIYFVPLIGAVGLVLVLNLTTSLLVFWKQLRISPVQLMRQDFRVKISPWLIKWQNKWDYWLKKWSKFRLPHTTIRSRFHSGSFRQLMVFMISIFVTSTISGLVLLIPNALANLKRFYFNDLNYENEFSYATPVSNSPLSKYAMLFWPGPKLWDRYVPDGAIITGPSGRTIGGFEQLADYSVISGFSGFIPELSFHNGLNSYQWGYQRYVSPNHQFNTGLLLSDTANSAFANLGRSLSLADLDFLLATLLHANISLSPNERLLLVHNIEAFYNSATFKQFLQLLIHTDTLSIKDDYHDFMRKLLRHLLPAFVLEKVAANPARSYTFNCGWQNILSWPEQDMLTTQLPVVVNQQNQVLHFQLLGLNTSNHLTKYINTESATNDKALMLDEATVQKLKAQLLTIARANFVGGEHSQTSWGKNIFDQLGHLLYSAADHTLYLPTLVNRTAQTKLNVRVDREYSHDLQPDMRMISFRTKTNQLKPILKQFWVYDDNDFAQAAINTKGQVTAQWEKYKNSRYLKQQTSGSHWNLLDPFALPNQSISFVPSFDAKHQLLNSAIAFVDYYKSNQGKVQPFVRPLFNFKNLELYLPQKLIDLDWFAHPDQFANPVTNQFLESDINVSDVPSTVTKGVEKKYDKWVRIRPFAPNYDRRFQPEDIKKDIALFTKKIRLWIFPAFYQQHPLLQLSKTSVSNLADQNPLLGLHIRPRIAGIINGGHDGANLYVNPALALLMGNYSLARSHNFHFANFYDPHKSVTIKGKPIRLMYDQPSEAVNNDPQNQFWFSKEGDRPYLWSNHKFSRSEYPLDISTKVAYVYKPLNGVNNMLGDFTITQDDGLSVTSANFNYQKKYFINNLTRIGTDIATFMILVVIINCFLATYLICDIFLSNYSKFMVILKMEGYSIRDLFVITVPMFGPYLLLGWGASVGLISSVTAVIGYVAFHYFSFYIPFLASWWLFFLTLMIVTVIFLSATLLIPYRFSENSIKLARDENLFS